MCNFLIKFFRPQPHNKKEEEGRKINITFFFFISKNVIPMTLWAVNKIYLFIRYQFSFFQSLRSRVTGNIFLIHSKFSTKQSDNNNTKERQWGIFFVLLYRKSLHVPEITVKHVIRYSQHITTPTLTHTHRVPRGAKNAQI